MGDTRRVVDGEDRSTHRPLRPAAPLDGPLAGSGAAPDEPATRLPRPRRPWLRSAAPADAPAAAAPVKPGETQAGGRDTAPPADDRPAAATDGPDTGAAGDPATAAGPKPTDRADAATTVDGGADPTAARPGDSDASTARPDGRPDTAATRPDGSADSAATADGGTDTTATKPGDNADGSSAAAQPGEGTARSGDGAGTSEGTGGGATTGRPAGARRRRVPFAHAVRQPPHRMALTAARATRDWSRRSSGRLTLPGVFLLALVLATAAAGALVVPATVRAPRPVAADDSATATPPPAQPGLPGGTPLPTGTLPPGGTLPTGPAVGAVATGRPADALAAWAQQVGPKVGISPVAMQAYGYAELVLAETNRSCGLSWTTLAAIGFVESGHGQANNAKLGPDGRALPEIIGLPLDGQGGRMRIVDTDRGQLDRDTTYDRAIGPMQFIPTTWQEIGADADNDGRKDPHDLDDAALAAGNYLCKGGRNLTIPGDWWNAILSYNDVRRYAQDVFDTANRYGQASRT
ncbi:lytic murein transglycosylase [Micromonospora sp. C28SCA-DRY-2]|uniref:lytic transglycosylase domain-containing protein n=1 Tax=Micromonospora sp. C28SCA-DRY-2 TaxID=3059522 RepID=UPI0026758904|nr:lytic murein transglycosylase [Micromonospora sp. C28SCA-DRY-2]MDO3702725.1 lytic murein transglycosylase [Micromonospora sp. C28SCA-DRY-2]